MSDNGGGRFQEKAKENDVRGSNIIAAKGGYFVAERQDALKVVGFAPLLSAIAMLVLCSSVS